MRKHPYRRYLPLPLAIGLLFFLSGQPLRQTAVKALAPLIGKKADKSKKIKLKIENQRLRTELHDLRQSLTKNPLPTDFAHEAIPARVILRSPASWSSSLWINVGSATNPIIQKNSPVFKFLHRESYMLQLIVVLTNHVFLCYIYFHL